MHVNPKKRFGQHFLHDKNVVQKIIDAFVSNCPSKNILEIGPGTGVLTTYLLNLEAINFKAIDVDRQAIEYLEANYPQHQQQFLLADVLKTNLLNLFDQQNFSVIGNFPYNISSQICFKILDYYPNIPLIVGMFQKEVAQRLAAKEGNKIYGILSVLLQTFYDIEYLFTVGENAFTPPPKVKSGVVRMTIKKDFQLDCNKTFFFKVVKAAFGQRRKILQNALKVLNLNLETIPPETLSKRAEQLSVNDFILLTQQLEKGNKH